MIVFCEECGSRNIIDPDQLDPDQEPIRCIECNDVLRYTLPAAQPARRDTDVPSSLPLKLELRLGRLLVMMSEDRPRVTMGRQRHNDIEIVDTRVSRSHARVELKDGRFILIDHSTNGTYVKINGRDDVINLKRNELPLEGSGAINLGRKIIDRPSRTIYFNLKA
jgi:predicted Zn finger-like uncharacterized protein